MEQKSGKKKRQLPNPLRPTNGNEVLRRELGDRMEGQGVTREDVRGDSEKRDSRTAKGGCLSRRHGSLPRAIDPLEDVTIYGSVL